MNVEGTRTSTMYDDNNDKRYRKLAIQVNRKVILIVLSYVLVFTFGFLAQVKTVVDKNVSGVSSVSERGASSTRKYGDGWHTIEVFYGKTEYFEQKYPQNEWYAQVSQDIIVSRLFGEKTHGYFIDLASNDAVDISNTYSLEKKLNWTGLCMEPNPVYWFDLAHRDCQVVGAVVGEIRNEAVLFQKTDVGYLGGIVGEEFDNHDENGGEMRYTVSLYEILNRFNAPKVIDYLSLDVEGAESLIMKHFPFHTYSFNVMTVERPKEDLKTLFEGFGYEYVGTVGGFGETIWVRSAIKYSLNIASIEEFLEK
jgi:hypothetical protein